MRTNISVCFIIREDALSAEGVGEVDEEEGADSEFK